MSEQLENIINKLTGGETAAATGQYGGSNGGFYCDAKIQGQMNDFINGTRPKLVALVGFADYGKSTFIGSLYHLLISNFSYGCCKLVDSDTYAGFERRVFLRRVSNDNTTDTKRTVLGESDLLHLRLRSDKGQYYDILISDKSGETYSKYISSDDDIKSDIVLAKADMVVFFVDAEEDSGKLAAHNLIVEKYESLLIRLKALRKISEGMYYVVVFTKKDKVVIEERKKKFTERKEFVCSAFRRIIGCDPKSVFEVNSTNLNDEPLNELFGIIIRPKERGEEQKNLDWVKVEIEKEK